MHDDVSNGASEPLTLSRSAWNESGPADAPGSRDQLAVEVTAAVIAIRNDQPVVLTRRDSVRSDYARSDHARSETSSEAGAVDALPATRFLPAVHATLDDAIRERVENDTGLELGFLEQLSSDCPRFLLSGQGPRLPRSLSVGHLALARADAADVSGGASWSNIYAYFPWEDWRDGRPSVLAELILPELERWVAQQPDHVAPQHPLCRHERVAIAFGRDGARWDDERVVERLDLLSESGLAGRGADRDMRREHRRVLGAALGRLRAKVRYRPVVFELLPADFTLFELQKSVEAILGPHLHKQNFRRLVEGMGLVEPTGEVRTHTGGRPAKLYRFRRDVLLERPAPGVRVRPARAG